MYRLARLILVLMLTALSAACASMTVSSHVDRSVDLSRFHTYQWGPADALPTGDPRLDQDPFFKDHFEGAVEKQLAAKGLAVATDSPDLLIHYHASITRRIDVNRVDRDYGYCYDENCEARAVEYEAGTLIIDIIDPKTNRLVWRGWAQRAIGDTLENRDHMAQEIDEAVTRMMAQFRRSM